MLCCQIQICTLSLSSSIYRLFFGEDEQYIASGIKAAVSLFQLWRTFFYLLCLSFSPIIQTWVVRGRVALLPQCVVFFCHPAYTVSFFICISIQCVSSSPSLNMQQKLWGHWFLLIFIIWRAQAEGEKEKAREEFLHSLSSFSLSKDAVRAVLAREEDSGKRKWLPFVQELEFIFCFLLSLCSSLSLY